MISLSLPLPPPLSALTRNVPRIGRVNTTRYKAWLDSAGNEILATPLERRKPILGKFTMAVLAGRPDKRQRDLDNLLKGSCDLLKAQHLIKNDCLAEHISIAWSRTVEPGRIRIWVWPWCAEREAIRALEAEVA